MRGASLLGLPLRPNIGKGLIISHIVTFLLCMAFACWLVSTNKESYFMVIPALFISLIVTEFFITPLGWITLKYLCDKQT